MIVMALDHVRDFFHSQAFTDDPLNLKTTTGILFFTRWVTHFCAPVFVFLSGISIYLQCIRKNKKQLSLFLIKRGFWLIFIEVTVMSFAFSFDINYTLIFLQTIWAIGISMVILAVILWLPFKFVLLIGLLIVFGHNILDFPEAKYSGHLGFGWSLLHHQNIFPLWDHHSVFIFYPFMPWTGLMLLGFCSGKLFTSSYDIKFRKKVLVLLGAGCIMLFVLLRFTNKYGDPVVWTIQKNYFYTFLSFINTNKYPPSLLYLSMTIGPAMIFLALFESVRSSFTKIMIIYGRVPFLYYIVHFYLIHFICMILFLLRGHTFNEGLHPKNVPFNFIIAGEGYSLLVVYIIWIGVVVLLYPICKWFSELKQNSNKWWLSYM